MGMNKKEFQEVQAEKSEEDFKYETSQRIQDLQFAIDQINKSLAECIASRRADKQNCDTQISNITNSTISNLKEFRQTLGDFRDEIKNITGNVATLHEKQRNLVEREELKEQRSVLSEEIKKARAEKESMKNELKILIETLSSEFYVKLKALKDEILSIPSEITPLKKLVDQKIELVELNGQNSLLRSANNEKQIMLVERKIENLYQLIKKIDISIQEEK